MKYWKVLKECYFFNTFFIVGLKRIEMVVPDRNSIYGILNQVYGWKLWLTNDKNCI